MRIWMTVIIAALITVGLLTLVVTGSMGAAIHAGAAGGPSFYLPVVSNNPAAPTGANVSATGYFTFQPDTVTVVAGTTVNWTNIATFNHTVTSDTLLFDQNPLNPGDTFSFRFTTPGTYAYHCRIHGGVGGLGMSGTITVVAPLAGD